MNKLSVVIITLNEEENIGRCIDSVSDIADEVVVVDSFSTDGTKAIAEAKGAKFILRAFANYIDQKNFAMEQSTHTYVLNLDADECLSKDLKEAIAKVKANGFAADAYSMNRLNFYCGEAIKTCGWYPDTKIRLWNKQKGKWEGELIHETLELQKGATLQHLPGDIYHYSFATHEAFVKQTEKFATIAAQQLKRKSIPTLVFKMLFSPLFKFIRNYFFKLGFTDGANGFVICFYQAREVLLKYYKAIQLKLA